MNRVYSFPAVLLTLFASTSFATSACFDRPALNLAKAKVIEIAQTLNGTKAEIGQNLILVPNSKGDLINGRVMFSIIEDIGTLTGYVEIDLQTCTVIGVEKSPMDDVVH